MSFNLNIEESPNFYLLQPRGEIRDSNLFREFSDFLKKQEKTINTLDRPVVISLANVNKIDFMTITRIMQLGTKIKVYLYAANEVLLAQLDMQPGIKDCLNILPDLATTLDELRKELIATSQQFNLDEQRNVLVVRASDSFNGAELYNYLVGYALRSGTRLERLKPVVVNMKEVVGVSFGAFVALGYLSGKIKIFFCEVSESLNQIFATIPGMAQTHNDEQTGHILDLFDTEYQAIGVALRSSRGNCYRNRDYSQREHSKDYPRYNSNDHRPFRSDDNYEKPSDAVSHKQAPNQPNYSGMLGDFKDLPDDDYDSNDLQEVVDGDKNGEISEVESSPRVAEKKTRKKFKYSAYQKT